MRPHTLFTQSAVLFAGLIFAFLMLCMLASYLLVVKPLLRTSVQDLAALIALSAQTWAELPPAQRDSIVVTAKTQYHLAMSPAQGSLRGTPSLLPYISLLESALSERTGHSVRVLACAESANCYAADIATPAGPLRFYFDRERIGTNPLLVLLIVVICCVALSIIGAGYLARRLADPLQRLAAATGKLSRGDMSITLTADGPRELAQLADDFNRMTERLREFMDARTTLLAGVSHDLRTPIARLRMAMELARRAPEPELFTQMERYLSDMNQLIEQFLSYSRDTRSTPAHCFDVITLLREQLAARASPRLTLTAPPVCSVTLPAVPLARVIDNLVENALRYSADKPVDVVVINSAERLVIEVQDRGPGIPQTAREDAFKPFVRLHTSRNAPPQGTGLGLAIVRHICDTYDWEVALLSRADGGTVARLTVPIAQTATPCRITQAD
jgi:two-component system osmolarity sensor histidine kinase EnvZ